jgi:hypothetical protein
MQLSLIDTLNDLMIRLDQNEFNKEDLSTSLPILVSILTKAGIKVGYNSILCKFKWREVAMSNILGHQAFAKTSTGRGGDAFDENKELVEYKSEITSINVLKKRIGAKKPKPIKAALVYNRAYGEERITPYLNQRHFYGAFDEANEQCLFIFEADPNEVVAQLLSNDQKRKPGATTNLNTVKFSFYIDDPRIVYKSPLLQEALASF